MSVILLYTYKYDLNGKKYSENRKTLVCRLYVTAYIITYIMSCEFGQFSFIESLNKMDFQDILTLAVGFLGQGAFSRFFFPSLYLSLYLSISISLYISLILSLSLLFSPMQMVFSSKVSPSVLGLYGGLFHLFTGHPVTKSLTQKC